MMGILVDVNLKEKDGKSYIEIVTEAYPYPVSFRGKYYQRSGATNQELKGAALDRFMLRKQGKTWDGVPVPYLKVEDLDNATFNLFQQIVKLMDLLCTKYMKAIITYEDIQRIETLPMPREALREALLNACINKDYAEPSPIQIRVYENRLEIINGGVLPEGWTVETLLSSHRSMPYNPDIANTFFRAGEIEAWGRGIERIVTVCKNDGFSTPEFRYDASGIWTTFKFEYPERAMAQYGQDTTRKTIQNLTEQQQAYCLT